MPSTLIVSVINDVIIKTLALRPQLTYQWTHGQSVTDIWFFLQAVRFSDVVDIDCSSFFLNLLFFRSWLLKNAQSECDVFYINVQSQNMVSPIRGQLLICSHQWITASKIAFEPIHHQDLSNSIQLLSFWSKFVDGDIATCWNLIPLESCLTYSWRV